MLGDERLSNLNPSLFVDGAVVAFGSDWPIDDFDEWYDLKVAAIRRGRDIVVKAPRLDMTETLICTVLRSATIDSAYAIP